MTNEEYDLQEECTICIFFSRNDNQKQWEDLFTSSLPNVIVIHFFPAATLRKNG